MADIDIDGELEEWSGVPYETINENSWRENSLNGRIWTGWNENGLAIAVELNDNDASLYRRDALSEGPVDRVVIALDGRKANFATKNPLSRLDELIVDRFEIAASEKIVRVVDSSDPELRFSTDDWHQQVFQFESRYSNNSVARVAGCPGAWVELDFEGDSISVYGKKSVKNGYGRLLVDGEIAMDFDAFSFAEQDAVLLCAKDGLGGGPHVARIETIVPDKRSVLSLEIRRETGGVDCVALDGGGERVGDLVVRGRSEEGGWRFELLAPWHLLSEHAMADGESLRFGYEVFDEDRKLAGSSCSAGITRQSDRLSSGWIVENGDRFDTLVLSGRPDLEFPCDFWTREQIVNEEAFLIAHASVTTPDAYDSVPNGVFIVNGKRFPVEPRASAFGNFVFWEASIPLIAVLDEAYQADVTFELPEDRRIVRHERYKSSLANALARIRQATSKSDISGLGKRRRALVSLFESSALSFARFLARTPNRFVDHYNEFAFFRDNKMVSAMIEECLVQASRWSEPDRDEEDALLFSVQPWRSRIDGTWQFFTVQMPRDFDRSGGFEALIDFHFQNKKQFSRPFFLLKEIQGESSPHEMDAQPDNMVWITPSLRGNAFESSGEEELQAINRWLEALGAEAVARTRISGLSVGGHYALLYAQRHCDEVSLLDLSSAVAQRVSGSEKAETFGTAAEYLSKAFGYENKWVNLRNVPTRISIGRLDEKFYFNNLFLFNRLKGSSAGSQLDVHPEHGHGIRFGEKYPLAIAARDIQVIPERYRWKAYSLRYGNRYELEVLEKRSSYSEYSVSKDAATESLEPSFELENVKRFRIDRDALGAAVGSIVINGQSTALPKDGARFIEYKLAVGERFEEVPSIMGEYSKRPGRQGPISDIELHGYTIVYGTLDSAMEPVLRDRGMRIAIGRRGSDAGQREDARIAVLSDEEFLAHPVEGSLWLVGGVSQNAVVQRFVEELPVSLDALVEKTIVDAGKLSGLFARSIFAKPGGESDYLLIEQGDSAGAYAFPIDWQSEYDFAIARVDGLGNPSLVRGLWSGEWDLQSGDSIIWNDADDLGTEGVAEEE